MSNLSHSSNQGTPVLIICGPTASGKTALALRLAEVSTKAGQFTSIISADSRQVYRGLNVLTGKDIPPEKANLRLFGLDLIDPDQTMNAGQYSAYARKVIAKEIKENRQVIVVGGTGFYLTALTQPASLAGVGPDEKLRQELNPLSLGELQQRLKVIDPGRLAAMNQSDVANPRRLIRAIEIASASIRPISPIGPLRPISFSWLGIRIPLVKLRERIERRVHDRLDHGAVAEVENLLKNYPDQNLPVYTTLGVKPILRYLAGEISRAQARQLWTTEEVRYAKRQLTWFAKQSSIIWYDQDRISSLSFKYNYDQQKGDR